MTAMQDKTVVDAKAVEDRMAAIEDTVCRHPLNREVLYRMLAYCAEERALDDLEREAASWPEFETATQNQYRLAEHLVRAGGLDRIERDEEFVRARPRAYNDIVELLRGRPVLETVIDGERRRMQPSVFVDKLERSGALVWKEGWCLTEEGDAFLRDLKASE